MKNFIIYASLLLSLLAGKLSAQETFEAKARAIADKIENITKEEKAALKTEIESVNKELEAGTITKDQADEKKLQFAEIRSKNIETRVGQAQDELKELVKQKVDGKIKQSKNNYISIIIKNDSIRKNRGERRTTSQFVFAAGVNNLVTDGSVANSDFRYWGSHFYEWGFTSNTRLFKNDNLLHLKYGLSVMYNNLRPTDNRLFVVNGNQTNLETSPVNLKDSRLRNVFVTLPVHLEFDFTKSKSKDGKKIFRTHESVRFGIGGYAGFRVKSKQKYCYELDGHDYSVKEKGDFNVNDFIYGVSTYIGYKETSLYLKYDLNPMFQDNAIKQNNISLGIRFDLN
ncbi:hypothetical protein [Flavobacterium sedimenticola]|uniref:Outer membrane protein beta-barrel domain-containing protein n=1 Tax=Flavobacterium sedimenticola TaxID=3043286 RepID=A0ABT6XRS8_9FLAO|nr:hypothetical protein [Flavobacterium sedimenticola]MDI9257800.1 hypothetical protein [Flavobacterium sedimenticola]